METAWLIGMVVGLPLGAYLLALIRPGVLWSTRSVPADGFRILTGIAFAAWVHPVLGILATHSAVWWVLFGWVRLPGGTLWPTVAMGVWLVQMASPSVIAAAIASLLAMGVVQVGFGLAQKAKWPYVLSTTHGMIHGTFGHRTALGIYLALVTPLAFSIDNPWLTWSLIGIYAVGLALSRSIVAGAAMSAGILWINWTWWPMAFGALALGAAVRWGPMMKARWAIDPHQHSQATSRWQTVAWSALAKPWTGRLRIWRIAYHRIRQWPAWVIGHGAGTFGRDSRTWYRKEQLREIYSECHNEYLETAYEYGAIGLLALGWVLWEAWPALAWGDPFTASLVATAVAAGFNFPLRVAPLAVVVLLVGVIVLRRAHGWPL